MISRAFQKCSFGILSLGSSISTLGSSLFTTQRAVDYAAHGVAHNAELPVSVTTSLASIFIHVVTRIPAIFKQLVTEPEVQTVEAESSRSQSCGDDHINQLSRKAQFVYYTLMVSTHVSGFFSSLASYLGAVTLAEFIDKYVQMADDAGDEQKEWKQYLIQGFALYIAASNLTSYYAFNYQKSKMNVRKVAQFLDDTEFVLDKTVAAKTFGISFFNVASTPFLAFFGTRKGLDKLTFIPMPDWLKKSFAGVSALTYFTSTMTTYVPAMYAYLNQQHSGEPDTSSEESNAAFEATVKTLGLVDSLRIGSGNAIGVIYTSNEVFNTGLYRYEVVIPAGFCMLSTTGLNMVFSIGEGYKDFVKFNRERQHTPTVTIEESNIQTVEPADFVVIAEEQLNPFQEETPLITNAGEQAFFGGKNRSGDERARNNLSHEKENDKPMLCDSSKTNGLS